MSVITEPNTSKISPWKTNPFLLILRWIAFIPIGFILSIILSVLVLLGFAWMVDNDGKMLIKEFFTYGYPMIGLLLAGCAAYGISMLTTIIAPKKKIGAIIYGTLYVLYAVSSLWRFYQQDYISKVLATITVLAISIGNLSGVVSAYNEGD